MYLPFQQFYHLSLTSKPFHSNIRTEILQILGINTVHGFYARTVDSSSFDCAELLHKNVTYICFVLYNCAHYVFSVYRSALAVISI